MLLRRLGWRNLRAQLVRQQARYFFLDDHTRFNVETFLEQKSDAASALRNFITNFITPEKLKIDSVRTDKGVEFEGDFQRLLDALGIAHKYIYPDMLQYNGVEERALGLLHDKTIAPLQDLKNRTLAIFCRQRR